MRELSLGEPLNDDDFKNWVTEALREIERASHEYGKEGTEAVSNAASDANPLMDGTAAPGTGTSWSREDHVHPTDTTHVVGPASSTNNGFAVYNGTTGKLLKDHAATVALGSEVSGTLPVANGGTGETGTAWTAYNPTVTSQSGTFTTVSATGRYKQIGKIVYAEIDVTITNAGSAAGYMSTTLPVTAASNKYVGIAFEYGATQKSGASIIAPALSTGACLSRAADGLTLIATGNAIAISIVYEAA